LRRKPSNFNVNVQELVPAPPKTRSRSVSHPEVCDLVRQFSQNALVGRDGAEEEEGGAGGGFGLSKSTSNGSGFGGGSGSYRVKLYTPGKSGGRSRKELDLEVEEGLPGGV